MTAPKRELVPFQWTKVPVPFVGGVDTRTDRKLIQPPKLGLLENAVFTTPGVLRKRYGYAKLADLAIDVATFGPMPTDSTAIGPNPAFYDQPVTDGRSLFTRAGSLWLRGQENFYSLSPDRQRWQREADIPNTHFVYGPRRYTDLGAPGVETRVNFTKRATTGGVTLIMHDIGGEEQKLLCIFLYANGYIGMVSFDAPPILTGNPLIYRESWFVADSAGASIGTTAFDAKLAPNGQILFVYEPSTANTLKYGYVDRNGSASSMSVLAVPANPTSVACAVEPTTGNFLISWADGTSTYAQMFNAAKVQIVARTLVGTSARNVVCAFRNPTLTDIFSDRDLVTPHQYGAIDKATLTTGGAATLTPNWLRHAFLISEPWIIAGKSYVLTGRPIPYTSFNPAAPKPIPAQRTAVLVVSGGVRAPMVLGAAYPGETDSGMAPEVLVISTPIPADTVGSVVWLTPRLLKDEDPVNPSPSSGQTYAGQLGVDYSRTPDFVEAGGGSYLSGSALWLCDGENIVESGFWEFPEFDNSADYVTKGTAGSLVTGSYSYRAYYEWTSATGEVYQSATGADVVVTFASGTTNSATIKVPTLTHTLKDHVQVTLYRTLINGTVFHLVARVDNDPTVDYVSITDGMADQSAQYQPFDYRSSAPPELLNVAPPGCTTIAVGNTRVFASGFEDPNLVLASKLRGFLEALNWNPVLAIQLPEANGEPVAALASLGDALIAFRPTHTYVIGGDGPDNVGLSGSFMPPRIVSDDIGCSGAGAVVRVPIGLLFDSQKGIYALGGDMGISYIGADVEGYNSATVLAAVSLPDRHEARFTLSTGRTLLFDYLARQWSVFTVGGIHAVIWQGRHVYLPAADQGARAETIGAFLDDGQPYGWAWEIAWIHVGENQNHQRVRTIQLLGEWIGDHSAEVWIAYNYEQAWSDRITIDMAAVINGEHFGDDMLYGYYWETDPASIGAGIFGGNIGGVPGQASGPVATGVYQLKIQPRR